MFPLLWSTYFKKSWNCFHIWLMLHDNVIDIKEKLSSQKGDVDNNG